LAAHVNRYPGFAQTQVQFSEWIELGGPSDKNNAVDFTNAVISRLNELQVIEPDPDFDASTCGL